MHVEEYDGSRTREVLIGMVTNDSVCAKIAASWPTSGLFDSDWANQVGRWCWQYWSTYQKAPGSAIRHGFEKWVERSTPDAAVVRGVEEFLAGLSEQAQTTDYDTVHLLDVAAELFTKVRLEAELEKADQEIERGYISEAATRMQNIRPVSFQSIEYVDPSDNFEAWKRVFEKSEEKPLVQYPGAIGQYFGNAFRRGEFYSWMGPDKTGKSSWLTDFAFRGLKQRRRVAFFDQGDTSREDVLLRFAMRMACLPEFSCTCRLPVGWDSAGDVEFDETQLGPIGLQKALAAVDRYCRKGQLRIINAPNSTLTVAAMNGVLADWELDGWKADVVVSDYADIMAPPAGVKDPLEKIDENWKQMRRLCAVRDVLFVTATQSDAAAYGKEKGLLTRKNFSGRKTKLAEVHGMLGINVASDERSNHRARINWIVRRKMQKIQREIPCVYTAGCFDLENPIFISRF